MKIWVIMQRETEYNDEGDEVSQEGAKIYKAFRNEPTKEQVAAAAWDAIQGKTSYSEWPDDMAYVEEIEVDESQIVQPEAVKLSKSPAKASKPATYAEAQARAAAARVEAAALAKQALEQGIAAIFEQYPDLEEFKWTQYTPHFNDGDDCTFSVHSDYPDVKLKGFDTDEGDPTVLYSREGGSDKVYVIEMKSVGSEYAVSFSYGRRNGSLMTGTKTQTPVDWKTAHDIVDKLEKEKLEEGYGNPYDDIKKFLASIDEDDMKAVYGDHVEVTATRHGTETDDYDHD